MSNHLRGEVEIKLGEDVFNCKLNFDSLVRIETALDTPIIKLAGKISEADMKMTEVSYILYTAIKGGGKDITEKEVNDLIWKAGFIDGIKACGDILSMALASGDEEKK
jgi:hypothetical protein